MQIRENTKLQAVVFRGDEKSHLLSESFTFSKSSLKPITALQPINNQYKYEGVTTLVDGLKGNSNYKTGRWIAFYKNDLEVVIDMQKSTTISNAAISTCVEKGDWVFDARSFTVEVSDNGVNYTRVASDNYPAMKKEDGNGVFNHKITFSPVQTRYVKVIVGSEKSIPEWHGGKGNPSFLFVDEISID